MDSWQRHFYAGPFHIAQPCGDASLFHTTLRKRTSCSSYAISLADGSRAENLGGLSTSLVRPVTCRLLLSFDATGLPDSIMRATPVDALSPEIESLESRR